MELPISKSPDLFLVFLQPCMFSMDDNGVPMKAVVGIHSLFHLRHAAINDGTTTGAWRTFRSTQQLVCLYTYLAQLAFW
jgi:hypothetical protein